MSIINNNFNLSHLVNQILLEQNEQVEKSEEDSTTKNKQQTLVFAKTTETPQTELQKFQKIDKNLKFLGVVSNVKQILPTINKLLKSHQLHTLLRKIYLKIGLNPNNPVLSIQTFSEKIVDYNIPIFIIQKIFENRDELNDLEAVITRGKSFDLFAIIWSNIIRLVPEARPYRSEFYKLFYYLINVDGQRIGEGNNIKSIGAGEILLLLFCNTKTPVKGDVLFLRNQLKAEIKKNNARLDYAKFATSMLPKIFENYFQKFYSQKQKNSEGFLSFQAEQKIAQLEKKFQQIVTAPDSQRQKFIQAFAELIVWLFSKKITISATANKSDFWINLPINQLPSSLQWLLPYFQYYQQSFENKNVATTISEQPPPFYKTLFVPIAKRLHELSQLLNPQQLVLTPQDIMNRNLTDLFKSFFISRNFSELRENVKFIEDIFLHIRPTPDHQEPIARFIKKVILPEFQSPARRWENYSYVQKSLLLDAWVFAIHCYCYSREMGWDVLLSMNIDGALGNENAGVGVMPILAFQTPEQFCEFFKQEGNKTLKFLINFHSTWGAHNLTCLV